MFIYGLEAATERAPRLHTNENTMSALDADIRVPDDPTHELFDVVFTRLLPGERLYLVQDNLKAVTFTGEAIKFLLLGQASRYRCPIASSSAPAASGETHTQAACPHLATYYSPAGSPSCSIL